MEFAVMKCRWCGKIGVFSEDVDLAICCLNPDYEPIDRINHELHSCMEQIDSFSLSNDELIEIYNNKKAEQNVE